VAIIGKKFQSDEDAASVVVDLETINSWGEIFQDKTEAEIKKIARLYDTVAVKYENLYTECLSGDYELKGSLSTWSVQESSHKYNRVGRVVTHISGNENMTYGDVDKNEIYVSSYDMEMQFNGESFCFNTDVALYSYVDKMNFTKSKLYSLQELDDYNFIKVGSFKLLSSADIMYRLPKLEVVSIGDNGELKTELLEQELPTFRIDDYLVIAFYGENDKNPQIVFQLLPNRSNKDFELSAWLNHLDILEKEKVEISSELLSNVFSGVSNQRLDSVANALNKYSAEYQINTPQRMAHFLGQIGYESGGLKSLRENYKYTRRRIVEIYGYNHYGHIYSEEVLNNDSRSYTTTMVTFNCDKCNNDDDKIDFGESTFTTRYKNRTEVATAFADTLKVVNKGTPDEYRIFSKRTDIYHQGVGEGALNETNKSGKNNLKAAGVPSDYAEGQLRIKEMYAGKLALFDVVYACRNGNGTINSKEGSKYFGVGFIHLTGKENYQNVYNVWKEKHKNHETINSLDDFADALKKDVDVAIEAAMIFWTIPKGEVDCNYLADIDDYDEITKFINGGTIAADERIKLTEKVLEQLNGE
jgi:predicted chitinase